ncbi:DUF72 domain-containing protein [Actinoallomurus iriomotensis]|uniref:DUF72 domain-containing protein n=1 Tax=Actinoallomurus iriomotensis TaxID=478107 RepID=A0A9W6RWL1_9ACTN|nr:DUF72 domain-containing protein [Actinoallomurus iriomotensis]GLY81477.1 hypothetical protein Airi01_097440 [Actinoallomurus iriomotensis]
MGDILVGTASWTDKTLLATDWYPSDVKTAEQRLNYYASRFPLVEVDSTYYAPPAERTVGYWRDRTPEGFTFNVKAFSLLTQHPTRPGALYKDLREKVPDKKNLYPRDLPDEVTDEVWQRFLDALWPLHEAGKLTALLFQFPQWFVIGKRNKEYILEARRRCDPMRICVEFRNRTWMSEENRGETLDFLTRYAVPYVSVDMPQGHTSSIPPVFAATSDLAVVRLHGHSDKWTSKNIYDRFGYLYSEKELKELAPKIRDLAGNAETTHVLLNNCYQDYAQRNATDLMSLLTGDDAP